MIYSRKVVSFVTKKAIKPSYTIGYRIPSLVDWDMYSDRNVGGWHSLKGCSLVDWDMYFTK